MPAVSSNSARRSVGFDERIESIWPCDTIAYEPGPRPVPISSSCTSRRRTGSRLM